MSGALLKRLASLVRRVAGTGHMSDQLRDLDARFSSLEARLAALSEQRYPKGPLYFGEDTALVATRWGGRLLVHTRDAAMAPCLVLEGEWEPELTSWLRDNLAAGQVFVDVGANIGYFTVLAGQLVGPSGQVLALEAHPLLAEILQRNIAMNGLYNHVTAHNRAAWSEAGVLPFHLRRNFTSSSSIGDIGSAAVQRLGDSQETVEVEAVALDDLLVELPGVDVLKIDVEGAEVQAFRGLEKTLSSNPDMVVIFEWAPALIEAAGGNCADLLDQLGGHGFAFRYFERGLAPIGRDELLRLPYGNVLARRG